MNFSADEGDAWDSTPTQDIFIRKYFAKAKPSNEVVSKRAKKRKKHQAPNLTSTCIQPDNVQNETPSKKFKLKNLNKKTKLSSSKDFESFSSGSNKNACKNNNSQAKNNSNNSCKKLPMLKSSKPEHSLSNISPKPIKNIIDSKDFSKNLHLAENLSSKDSLINHKKAQTNDLKKKKLNICKTPQRDKDSSCSKYDKNSLNSYVSIKIENEDIQIKQQKKKKRKLKANKISQNSKAEKKISTAVQNFIVSTQSNDSDDELPPNECHSPKNKFKTKKITELNQSSDSEDEETQKELPMPKKNKPKTNMISHTKKKSPVNETKDKTKKLKTYKNISKAEQCSQNESGNSEEDDEIRSELQNSRMFLKIQKLMKMAPHLNPNYCEDSEENAQNSSLDEISSEYSSSQSEGEYLSKDDNEAVAKGDGEESAGDLSEDSFNSNEDDSTDSKDSSKNEEKYIKSSEPNQVKIKQVIPDVEFDGPTMKKPITFMEKARSKLAAAKFRLLNEKLYTETGGEAYRYFQDNREEFDDYHLGYRQQVSKWPLNPVDEILKDLQKLKKGAVIADLGCGEAKIARVLSNRTVHSFDLVAKHQCVTACDFSKVPLKDSSVDVAVFCLSLMGVNLVDYLREAYRILKIGGTLKIAEVESRVEDLDLFIENLKQLGFDLERKNTKHKLFVFLDLKKVKKKKAAKAATITLRPCMYKKR